MNCVEFENRLAALCAGDIADSIRAGEAALLRRHAATCDECGGASALLDVMALPTGARDLAPDPGPEYWDTFDARLAARIASAEADRVGRLAAWRRVAAAALLVSLIPLAWSLRAWVRPRPSDPALTWLIAANLTPAPAAEPLDFPEELESLLEQVPRDRAAAVLAGFAAGPGHAVVGSGAAWEVPDAPDPAADLAGLVGGLDDLEQIVALGEWLPGHGTDSLAAEADLPGAPNTELTPFPDARALDVDARQEFLRWLSESIPQDADVS